jgi:hypothetical protein
VGKVIILWVLSKGTEPAFGRTQMRFVGATADIYRIETSREYSRKGTTGEGYNKRHK